ncbi:MAG: murein transglycosylase A [Burkholderiaceae bacterium]
MNPIRLALITLAALTTAACQITPRAPLPDAPPPAKTDTVVRFEASDFAALPATADADWSAALPALIESCRALAKRPAWTSACAQARQVTAGDARAFFQRAFTPYQIFSATLVNGTEQSRTATGLMTGYYEPLLTGSRTHGAPYLYPLHKVPDDLLEIDLGSLYPELAHRRLRGKLEGRKVVPYESRAEITGKNTLAGQELVWVSDPIEAFFLQVQGSGRVQLPDGSRLRVGYADQNGHPYKAIGRWLVDQGELKMTEVSMQSITDWARRNPQRLGELLNQNPSYVFFRASAVGDPKAGPKGALGVPLTPERSVAVDRRFIPLGAPLVITAKQASTGGSITRPVLAQDTGGAIRGPLRFDYFWGFGAAAGQHAGRHKSEAAAWLLVPRGATPADL